MRPLDIVLGVGLNADAPRGIDYYIANVVHALARVDETNRYAVFSYFWKEYERKRARLPLPARFEARVRKFPERLVNALEFGRGLPLIQTLLLGPKPDVYHLVGGGLLPRLSGIKTVVTFFDLAVEAFPKDGSAPEPGKKINDPATYETATRADVLLATGEYTKRDLMRYYGVPARKIAVVPTGVNLDVFKPVDEPAALAAVRAKYRLPERFVMTIGPYIPERRTNAASVIRAYAELASAGVAGDTRLVLAGSAGQGGQPALDALLKLAADLRVGDRVSTTGFIDLADLPAIYGLSQAVVHPTSVEGFGFGMEVMACRAAFITSDRPGVVEAVGEDALTVPPNDVPALREALRRMLTEPGLRPALLERGLARARRFGYDRIAERLRSVYESLA